MYNKNVQTMYGILFNVNKPNYQHHTINGSHINIQGAQFYIPFDQNMIHECLHYGSY